MLTEGSYYDLRAAASLFGRLTVYRIKDVPVNRVCDMYGSFTRHFSAPRFQMTLNDSVHSLQRATGRVKDKDSN